MAEHFEVSRRTIERDLSALQQAGVPIYATPGRRGGYALDLQHTLPPLNFSASEVAAVATALALDRSTPFTHAGRVRLFGSATEAHRPLPAVERAIVERKVVEIVYVDKHGESTTRTVEPVSVMGVKAHWYLWGFCRLREAPRVFRLDKSGRPRCRTKTRRTAASIRPTSSCPTSSTGAFSVTSGLRPQTKNLRNTDITLSLSAAEMIAMTKFVFLYHGYAPPLPGHQAAWGVWLQRRAASFVEVGAAFGPGRLVTGERTYELALTSNPASGYSIVEAEHLDAAEQLLEGCPIADSVSLYEALSIDDPTNPNH